MKCHRVQRSLSSYCDDRLSGQERQEIFSHLAVCQDCASVSERLFHLRAALRNLPSLPVPSHLTTSLQVLASRERAQQLHRAGLGGSLAYFVSHARLWLDDIMRPIALPFAGGFLSAVVLFCIMLPVFAPPENSGSQDVPTMLSTEAAFASMGPFGLSDEDIVVDVTVDEQGRVVDYSTPSGARWVKDPEVKRSVENSLLFTVFTPGTSFGQPVSGKIRITLRRSEIDVKG